MRRRGAVLAIALAASLAASGARAQSAGEWGSPAQLWRATCRYCHGDGVARELRGAGLSPQAIETAVRSGPKAMPSFAPSQISDPELEQLAEWISTQKAPAQQPVDRSSRESRHGSRERSR
ncbi:MAG TPA: cytochrome c [Steroidobacteraceae bacterium]|nr:cytochrome c [Steroidobacteraceae bacterium]